MPKIRIRTSDKLFSQWIRIRDGRCLRCGSSVKFNNSGLPISHNASHFQGRGKENTRFNPDNVCTLCYGCHSYFTAHPAEHTLWQVERLGQKKVDEIVFWSNQYKKRDDKLEAMLWKQELTKLQDKRKV